MEDNVETAGLPYKTDGAINCPKADSVILEVKAPAAQDDKKEEPVFQSAFLSSFSEDEMLDLPVFQSTFLPSFSEDEMLDLPKQIFCPVSKDTILTHRASPEVDKMYSRFSTEYDLTTEKFIASGAFGVVVQCKNIIDKQTYAIKKISMAATGGKGFGKYADFEREFINLAKFDSPFIVRYHTTWIEGTFVGESGGLKITRAKPCVYIQQQLCECTLKEKLKEKLPMHECGRIFKDLVWGLEHIHSQNVVHGDLGTRNVFCYRGSVKIGDFGLSRILGEPDKKLGLKDDVYSLGVMLVEIIFSGSTEVAKVKNGLRKKTPEFPKGWPDGVLKNWITKMLKSNPQERPSVAEIKEALKEITVGIEDFDPAAILA